MATRRDGTQPIIAHGSVYLRPAEREDIPLFVRWFNDYAMSRNSSLRAPMSMTAEEQWFERAVANQGKDGYHFVACLLADDRPIGTVGLFDLDLVNGSAALGISIGAAADRGKGHGTDMLRALLAFGFASLRLERIELDVYDFNTGAHRLYQRVGFVDEGVARHRVFREGRYVDLFRMSILADEWRATQDAASGRRDSLAPGLPLREGLEQPVDGVEQRLRDRLRQHVPQRVLRAVCRAHPQRRAPQVRDVIVAQPVRQRLEVGDPARRAAVPRGGERPVRRPCGHEGRLVDHRRLVAGRPAPGLGSLCVRRGHRSESEAAVAPDSAGRTRTSARRLRSDPLTRIRNE